MPSSLSAVNQNSQSQLIEKPAQAKYETFHLTTTYLDKIFSWDFSAQGIAAKISFVALPIFALIATFTLATDLILALVNYVTSQNVDSEDSAKQSASANNGQIDSPQQDAVSCSSQNSLRTLNATDASISSAASSSFASAPSTPLRRDEEKALFSNDSEKKKTPIGVKTPQGTRYTLAQFQRSLNICASKKS